MDKPESPKKHRMRFFRRERHRRLKSVTLLPSLITLLNGLCGFSAIVFASRAVSAPETEFSFYRFHLPYFAMAGYMIFVAMIADMLDGRVARMSHSTSGFGGQLDSLCDVISFGVAPAFLMFKLVSLKLNEAFASTPTVLTDFVQRFIWLSAAIYFACAAIRLARFNVENEEDETAHMFFTGLPTPASAGVVASVIVLYDDMARSLGNQSVVFTIFETLILYSLPFVCIVAAIMMVSRVRYPHIVNQYFKGRKPVTHLFWTVAVFGTIYLFGLPMALVISFCGFMFVGIGKWLWLKVLPGHGRNVLEEQQPAVSAEQLQ